MDHRTQQASAFFGKPPSHTTLVNSLPKQQLSLSVVVRPYFPFQQQQLKVWVTTKDIQFNSTWRQGFK